ncbi:MAG: hypothetical protein ACR5KV_04420 [Wolbachia sp.]
MGISVGENSKRLKDDRNQSVSPKKFKSMSSKQSQYSGQRLWNALEALINVGEKLKKIKLKIGLKKDAEISEKLSNEGIEKVVKLEGK